MNCLAGYRQRRGRWERRGGRGEFAVVAHNMFCFVEGGSQGHSEGDEEKTDVCLCNVCGRKGPVRQQEEKAGRQTDRQMDRGKDR